MSHILVIDDELSIRRLLRILLEGAGHEVSSAEDASHGLHELALSKPDLLILDLGLPDMDGLEALRRLREWTQLPVLILSARPGPEDKVTALDVGADDYLTKPFDASELLARMRALLRRKTPRRGDAFHISEQHDARSERKQLVEFEEAECRHCETGQARRNCAGVSRLVGGAADTHRAFNSPPGWGRPAYGTGRGSGAVAPDPDRRYGEAGRGSSGA